MYLSDIPLSAPKKRMPKPPPGYAWEWVPDNSGLSGLGKFKLKKVFKKVVSAAKKVVKAVAPIAVPIIGGAIGAKLYAAYAAKRKAMGASDAQIEAETVALQKQGVSPEQAAFQPAAMQRALVSAPPGAPDVSAPIQPESGVTEMPKPAMPGWLLPVGAAAVIAFLTLR